MWSKCSIKDLKIGCGIFSSFTSSSVSVSLSPPLSLYLTSSVRCVTIFLICCFCHSIMLRTPANGNDTAEKKNIKFDETVWMVIFVGIQTMGIYLESIVWQPEMKPFDLSREKETKSSFTVRSRVNHTNIQAFENWTSQQCFQAPLCNLANCKAAISISLAIICLKFGQAINVSSNSTIFYFPP